MHHYTQRILNSITLSAAALATTAYADETAPRHVTAKDTLDAASAAIAEAHRAPHRAPYTATEPNRRDLANSINSAPVTPGQSAPPPLQSTFSEGPAQDGNAPRRQLIIPDSGVAAQKLYYLNNQGK